MPILFLPTTNLGKQTLHKLGVDLDAVDAFGETAATIASSQGNIEILKLLGKMKADFTLRSPRGTAMHCAMRSGHTKILEVTFYVC